MKLIGLLKEKVEEVETKEAKKAIIAEAGMELTDDELDGVAGGGGDFYRSVECPYCGRIVEMDYPQVKPTPGLDHDKNCPLYKISCLLPGTLLKLADGSDKKVEDIVAGDILLTWNLETGSYDVRPVMFNDSEELATVNVIHVVFSDGTTVDVVGEHGFFDIDLAKYIYITDEQGEEFIGHSFVRYEENGKWQAVKLVKITFEEVTSKVYSPVSFGDLVIYANGMLSLPGACTGFVNIFDVNTDTMSFDKEKMAKDIETYGLLEINDFNGMISEEVFEGFNGKYLGVSMAKGLTDMNKIKGLIFRYAPYLESLHNEVTDATDKESSVSLPEEALESVAGGVIFPCPVWCKHCQGYYLLVKGYCQKCGNKFTEFYDPI